MQEVYTDSGSDIPTVLLANCWALIAAEKRRIRVESSDQPDTESYSAAFMRALYNRFDQDRDGRLDFSEMHNIFNIYMSDLTQNKAEIPRDFSDCVVNAVLSPESDSFVRWSEFYRGFPVAVRQRLILWDEWNRRQDLRSVDFKVSRSSGHSHE